MHEPATEYRVFRIDDGVSYVHWMAFPDEAAESAHREAPYTREFVDTLYPLCEREPEFESLTEIEPIDERERA